MYQIDAAMLGDNCEPTREDLTEIASRLTAAGYPTEAVDDAHNDRPYDEPATEPPEKLFWEIVSDVLPANRGGSATE